MPKKQENSSAEASADAYSVAFEIIESGSGDAEEGVISVLVYSVGSSSMAINVDQTEGVVDCPRVTPLPNAPDSIIGVASVRGRMTLVMDLSAESDPAASKRRLLLIKGEKQIGLLADRVEGVLSLRKIRQRSSKEPFSSVKSRPQIERAAVSCFRNGEAEIPIIDAERLVENA